MAVPGNTQALIAAFAFGIVVNAASAALFLYVKGSVSSVFRDGLRLALVTFLASAALWAQVDFVATVIDPSATSGCQVAVAFAAGFDQIARVSLEQYLLWAVNTGPKVSARTFIPQTVLLARFILGAVFVGLSRPQFNPVCVAETSVLPVGITVVVMDATFLLFLVVRVFQVGMVDSVRDGKPDAIRGKAVLFVIAGLALWTGASVPMLLGIGTIELAVRTVVPAVALSVLVGLVAAFTGTLVIPSRRATLPPEAPSPRDISTRDLSSSDTDYPPSQYEDLKGGEISRPSAFVAPREVPWPDESTRHNKPLPTIAQPLQGQAEAGMGGVPVQGQLFPPMRSQTAPASRELPRSDSRGGVKPKKSLFDLSRSGSAAAVTAGRVAISNPILQEGEGQNPLKKIATIDLATAARNERERRDQALLRSSGLIAKRPAPQPPTQSSEEQLKRAQSFKRKEIASVASPSPKATPRPLEVPPATAMPIPFARTTSAQSSPRVEEVRRRSPRQAPEIFKEQEPTAVTPPKRPRSPPPAKTPPQAAAAQPAVQVSTTEGSRSGIPKQASVRVNIRPSRQRPVSPPPVEEKRDTMTAVQKLQQSGLPRNPRAQAMKALTKEAGVQRQQTVMFINTIEYNDPGTVESIIQDANDMAAKSIKSPGDGLPSGNSIVHRPRPIPRNLDKDRAVFPAEPSPGGNGHKGTKSGGPVVGRKSILQAHAGSPTQLPPLPPPPKGAGNSLRPLPNDTKSMTFDEKMAFLFQGSNQESSIPEIPAVPRSFLDVNGSVSDDTRRGSGHNSDWTTKSSTQTPSVLEIDEISQPPPNVSKFSVDTYRTDAVGSSWLPAISSEPPVLPLPSFDGAKRQSSPLLGNQTSPSNFSDAKTRDGGVTDWGSVHSPVAAVNIQQARQVPKATYIHQRNGSSLSSKKESSVPRRDGKESMTIMLDPSTPHDRDFNSRASQYDKEAMPKLGGPRQGGQWHRRVGDECPTFSDRKEKVRPRKMPPPTPLLLNLKLNKNAIIIQAPEPSPLESPQEAYKVIQAQLRKLDQPNRGSAESSGRRLALLENLELEMGQQENHWLEMQHDMARESISTLKTSPTADSHPETTTTRDSSQRNIAADRRASRRARMRSGSVSRQSIDLGTPSSQSSENTRASMWQQRLAEAQMEYADNASDLLGKHNRNFLVISKAQLGSPTPPDTDESDNDDHIDSRLISSTELQSPRPSEERSKMWAPTPTHEAPPPSTAALWTPGPKASPVSSEEPELPAASIRPAVRKSTEVLSIESDRLWQKEPSPQKKPRPTSLWRGSIPQPQKAPRPVTQRPPRRSRRVTLLPDILESPEPLPDKRGTLGIFQFPWGEKSDTATIQTRTSNAFMAMPGTMTSGASASVQAALEARSKQLESQEYSSSFFDDYDEEDEDNVSDLGEEEDSDDDFDENTLWEIASLLKTNQVPSKSSFFPQGGFKGQSTFVEDYIEEVPSDGEIDEDEDDGVDSIVVGLDSDAFPMPPRRNSQLWAGNATSADLHRGSGLPQPDERTWNSYLPPSTGAVRVQARKAEPASIQSNTLWNASHKPVQGRPVTHLWSQGMSMWSASVKTRDPEPRGLFSTSHKRAEYRSTVAEPAALHMIRTPRVSHEPLARLTSSKLWKPTPVPSHTRHWIRGGKMVPLYSVSHEIYPIPASRAGLKQPVRRQHRPTIAYRADWDSALKEAIVASYPGRKRRHVASPSQWNVALQEAISAGHGRHPATAAQWDAALEEALTQTMRHDVTKRHPVFAASSMITRSPWFHPAATGYTYDPAVVNPVFFGSLAVTSENVHPAMSAWAARKLRRQASKNAGRERKLERSESRGRRMEELRAAAPAPAAEAVKEIPARQAAVSPPLDPAPLERSRSRSRSTARAVGTIAKKVSAKTHVEAAASAPAKTEPEPVGGLWSKAVVSKAPRGLLWVPKPKPAVSVPSSPPTIVSMNDADAAPRRERKAPIGSQTAATEWGVELPAFGFGFDGQGMWSRYDGEERLPRPLGGRHNWLADSIKKPVNRVQFRY